MSAEKKRRLFVALPLPLSVRQALLTVRAEQGNFLQQAQWVPLENLHVTVFFIGYVDEGVMSLIEQELGQLASLTVPFSLTLQAVTWAPPRQSPRMIWANFAPSDEYRQLAIRVSEALCPKLNICPEQREPLAHVTLVRFRDRVDRSRLLSQPSIGQKISVTGYELMESKLAATGARYQVLREFNFRTKKL